MNGDDRAGCYEDVQKKMLISILKWHSVYESVIRFQGNIFIIVFVYNFALITPLLETLKRFMSH